MRKFLFTLAGMLLTATLAQAKQERVTIQGSVGKLVGILQTPETTSSKKVPMVIIFHGFSGNKNEPVMCQLADSLEKKGIASVRFDFNSHGESEGDFVKMTLDNELEDARCIYNYARSLSFVGNIGIFGHSQGGVISVLLSSELGKEKIKAVSLLAPGLVIKEDVLRGICFGKTFDPANIPDSVELRSGRAIGRDYILSWQRLQPIEAEKKYDGDVLAIHGTHDQAVPYSYSENLKYFYKHVSVEIIPNADHTFTGVENILAGKVANFMANELKEE